MSLVRIPLAEGEDIILILNLLGNQGRLSTAVVSESDSVLANVLSLAAVVRCRGIQVVSSDFELREATTLHLGDRVFDLLLGYLVSLAIPGPEFIYLSLR